jgi:hypothetical protein
MLLQAFRTLCIALLKMVAILFAWFCKIYGWLFVKLSELIFKLVEKYKFS